MIKEIKDLNTAQGLIEKPGSVYTADQEAMLRSAWHKTISALGIKETGSNLPDCMRIFQLKLNKAFWLKEVPVVARPADGVQHDYWFSKVNWELTQLIQKNEFLKQMASFLPDEEVQKMVDNYK